VKNWKFDWLSAIGGFVVGALLMVLAGTLRPPT